MTGAIAAYLTAISAGEAKSEGIRLGEAVALSVLNARANDGSGAADAYRPKTSPGVYVQNRSRPLQCGPASSRLRWRGAAQFRPQAPLRCRVKNGAPITTRSRSSAAGPASSAPPGNGGRSLLARARTGHLLPVSPARRRPNLDLLDSARFMALIAVAKSDAFIAVFDAKYHYDFWRPITAIRNGDIDDNPRTERDATWQPLATTPMHPEYPCSHCIQSGCVAAVVKAVLGTVDIPEVALTSPTAPGVTHRWTNLDGLYRRGCQCPHLGGFPLPLLDPRRDGYGASIGEYVVKNLMQPAARLHGSDGRRWSLVRLCGTSYVAPSMRGRLGGAVKLPSFLSSFSAISGCGLFVCTPALP